MTDENDILPDDQTPGPEGADETPEETFARLEAEAAEWKDRALRAIAEADNVKRRAEREMNDARAFAIQRFARDLLGVADNLQRALAAAPKDAGAAAEGLVTGLELTEKTLLAAFENNGLKRVDPEAGAKFDPHLHQAMMEQPATDGVAPGAVLTVMQPGYELFGRVVRPAMVAVAAKGAPSSSKATPAGAYDQTDEAGPGAEIDQKA